MRLFRMKSAWLFPLLVILLGTCYVLVFHTFEDKVKTKLNPQHVQEPEEAYPVTGPLTVEVHLQRNYLDGEQSVEVVHETIWSMEDFWSAYEGWELVDQDLDRMIFEQEIDDISPISKVNGYFGLTEEGILTIFNGSPVEEDVIQSFYQVDVEKLESSLFQKLEKGIPVKSKQNYQAVLDLYKPYAVDKKG